MKRLEHLAEEPGANAADLARVASDRRESERARQIATLDRQVEIALEANATALRRSRTFLEPGWVFSQALLRLPDWCALTDTEAAERLDARLGGAFSRVALPFAAEYNARQERSIIAQMPEAWAAGFVSALGCRHTKMKRSAKVSPSWQDPLQSFLKCWNRQKANKVAQPLSEAILAARRVPLYEWPFWLGEDLATGYKAGLRGLAAIAREGCAASPGGIFALPCYAISDRLGVDRRTVAAWISALVERGFLELVSRAEPNRRAAVYRWTGP